MQQRKLLYFIKLKLLVRTKCYLLPFVLFFINNRMALPTVFIMTPGLPAQVFALVPNGYQESEIRKGLR